MRAKVSIIMTVYNRERYLRSAIDSFLAQTWTDAELLIWDDGSTDLSEKIALNCMECDSRVRVVHTEHIGRGQALHKACASAVGSYLGWLDSDDLLCPTALEETVTVLDSQPEVGLVYTDYTVIDELGQVQGIGERCHIPYSKERLLSDFMTFHFRLMRRSAYDRVGGVNPKFTCAQDYDLCLRLSEVTNFQQLKKSLYFYRVHQESISYQQRTEQIHFTKLAISEAVQRRRSISNDWK